MNKSETFQKTCSVLAIIVAVAGILLFLFAPVVSLRPKVFGAGSGISVEMNMSIWELRSSLSGIKETVKDELGDIPEKAESLLARLPDSMKGQYQEYMKLIKLVAYFPAIFTGCLAAAVLGFAVSAVFGLTGLLGIRKKWNNPKLISVGGAIYILSGLVMIGLTAKILYDFLSLSEVGELFEWLGVENWARGLSITPGDMVKLVLGCLGPGLILSLLCALCLIAFGCVLPESCAAGSRPAAGGAGRAGDFRSVGNAGNEKAARAQERFEGKLVGISGEYNGYEIELPAGQRVTLGSDPSVSQIVFSGNDIAPRHCSIVCRTDAAGSVRYEIQSFTAYATRYGRDGKSLARDECVSVNAGTELWLTDGANRFRLG